ncbi:Dps family protein [Lacihabitans soyangensis]|jgi:starvation-inducible DNA-binding protein|uniref:DNA starvation/stationary phase protection protein n=1 Tax=Lacihabitans soyangensis TaxID=869394 RepID=A0AAE3KWD1_9BACT|nr:DNA starvation/stationary phase protection protein [Lacihabitans soyangensis]MCP9765516.1 DNA starvation/stationary phase protection protein [Lacihabitans soyangensis]
MKPSIGLSEESLNKSVKLLSVLLSDEVVLYTKTRNFHWNVFGESFMELHKLFQAQYTELEETIDTVAERIGKLGGKAIGTMKEFLENTRLKENPGVYPAQKVMLVELVNDHQSIIVNLRKDIETTDKNGDAGTTDFLTGILEYHETTAWILRRYLN